METSFSMFVHDGGESPTEDGEERTTDNRVESASDDGATSMLFGIYLFKFPIAFMLLAVQYRCINTSIIHNRYKCVK